MVVGAVVTAAFGDEHSSPADVDVEWVPDATAGAPTATQVAPTPAAVRGLAYPVEDACLPEDDNLMPGAPRDYRNGTHEGVDFYDSDNCAVIGLDTDVVAAKAGTVVRADWTYVDLTEASLVALFDRVEQGESSPDIDDAFRGRQVWIEHDDGTVTRYAHLSGIVEGIDQGALVQQGEPIAFVGDSGTPESVTNPETQIHLHFEIRVGESYLGADMDPEAVRALYEAAFEP